MASTETPDEILQDLLQQTRNYNKRSPSYQGLRECTLDLTFPPWQHSGEASLPCRETVGDADALEGHFSARVQAFFSAVHQFEDLSTTADDECLIRDGEGLWLALRIIPHTFTSRTPQCLHRQFPTHRLSLLLDHPSLATNTTNTDAALPQLHHVKKLRVFPRPDWNADLPYQNVRAISPRVPLELATRFLPQLRELDCPWLCEHMPAAFSSHALRHYTRPWEGPWRDARIAFGDAARELHARLPASLKVMRLWFWLPSAFSDLEDQAMEMPDLVGAGGVDPVSDGVQLLATHLERLDVRAFLTPDLFRGALWNQMRQLTVEFHPWCPDGSWYFVGPRGEGEDDTHFEVTREKHYPPLPGGDETVDREIDAEWAFNEGDEMEQYSPDAFRTEPRNHKIEPLLLAFAAALRNMTVLDEAELFAWLAWRPSEERMAEYVDAQEPFNQECAAFKWGVSYVPAKDATARGSVTWQVGAWRPHEGVLAAFRELGEVDMVWRPLEFLDSRPQEDLSVFT